MHCSVTTRYRNAGLQRPKSWQGPFSALGSLKRLCMKPQTHGSDRHSQTGVRVPVLTLELLGTLQPIRRYVSVNNLTHRKRVHSVMAVIEDT